MERCTSSPVEAGCSASPRGPEPEGVAPGAIVPGQGRMGRSAAPPGDGLPGRGLMMLHRIDIWCGVEMGEQSRQAAHK